MSFHDRLLATQIPEVRHRITRRDTILYALGIGLGADPLDEAELDFLLEDRLQALPTMGVTLGYPGLWLAGRETGADVTRLLHGEQSIEIFRSLPVEGEVIGRTKVERVIDRGRQKGAFVYTSRDVLDAETGELLCRLGSTSILRGNGGFGGPDGPVPVAHVLPERSPDFVVEQRTLSQAALIYRLSGDLNPLHSHPERAKEAGFDRPILHGLCTFGIAGWALLRQVCGGEADRFRSMRARFTAPVFPGETLRTEIWDQGGEFGFRVIASERAKTVLNNGLFQTAHSDKNG